jgi:hypothetical protein
VKTMALRGSAVVGSGSRLVSTIEDVEADVSADMDSNGRRRWWPMMGSRGISDKKQGGSGSRE